MTARYMKFIEALKKEGAIGYEKQVKFRRLEVGFDSKQAWNVFSRLLTFERMINPAEEVVLQGEDGYFLARTDLNERKIDLEKFANWRREKADHLMRVVYEAESAWRKIEETMRSGGIPRKVFN